ncbi:unnamed protein product [Phytophthora lilii]|uniref:Unnamed protein product n=1 Tax=Phytophthora lilii TaxID=2077276 RepID=A0A9W6WWK0_9STRA|nr:unnamed protein product [Phytophthora lilii]
MDNIPVVIRRKASLDEGDLVWTIDFGSHRVDGLFHEHLFVQRCCGRFRDRAFLHYVDKSSSSHKIDLIQRALNTSSRDIKMFASSWAPPAWMTTKNTTINCSLKGSPGEEYWEALALYYSKFFDAYSKEGIDFWAMTVQNEPSKSILQTSAWQSLRLTAEQERDFVKLDLGPMMARNHPNLKIIAGDDQKSGILDRLALFEDADALKYISGLGVHWYRDLDFFLASAGGDFDKLLSFYGKYPDIFMLATGDTCQAGSAPDQVFL